MAQTLIGRLLLRIKAEGLGEANKVASAMDQIERKARAMGAGGVRSWGVGFQRQLDKLKLTADQIGEVERSWIRLHESMKTRRIDRALRSSEISHWRTSTISQLGMTRAAVEDHFRKVEKGTRGHIMRMKDMMRAGIIMAGAYTMPYLAGQLGLEAVGASSERRREFFRQRMANIPEGDQQKIFDRSQQLSEKYPSVPITAIMEMARSSYTTMGGTERGLGVLDKMVEAFVSLQSARGLEVAGNMLIGLLRGLDNFGVNKSGQVGIDRVNDLIEAATKGGQIDPDFDPGTYFTLARRAKVAGPALSPEFLARASVYMQDMGPDAAGTSLAMAFKSFVLEAVGSAGGKKYLAERNRLGIRGENGLNDAELFGSDPDKWVVKHLIPALIKDGVDMNNDTAIATAIGKLSGASNATALLTRMVTQREQIEKWLELLDDAMGTRAAGEARGNDPFVAWKGFLGSMQNLSAALVPIDSISAGLNNLADGIKALARAGEDNPFLAALGIGSGTYGAYKGVQWSASKFADMFGLKASAVALDGSAAALTRAAVALGGRAVADGVPGGGKMGVKSLLSGKGAVAAILTGVVAEGTRRIISDLSADNANEARRLVTPRQAEVQSMKQLEQDYRDELVDRPVPYRPKIDDAELQSQASSAASALQAALSVVATPTVNAGSIQSAVALARELVNLLNQAGTAAEAARSRVGAEMRRNFADGGE